jgi:hypothetical protein
MSFYMTYSCCYLKVISEKYCRVFCKTSFLPKLHSNFLHEGSWRGLAPRRLKAVRKGKHEDPEGGEIRKGTEES